MTNYQTSQSINIVGGEGEEVVQVFASICEEHIASEPTLLQVQGIIGICHDCFLKGR